MPEQATIKRARRDKREGKSATTQAGEFVREEMHHIREGKHGASSTKQAIAIGLSKARRAGVDLPPPPGGEGGKKRSRRSTRRKGSSTKSSPRRARASREALEREPHRAGSHEALSRQAHEAARRRSAADRSAAAKKAARTKGAEGRSEAARKASRTRERESQSASESD
jgi:hypothetical protein